ncbi:MAG: ferrous iron transport protein A [Fimbriimonadaceae bacterium]|nr:ferrous iron transport protein A [Fimbriimonadaceae bacterium]
MVETRVPEAAPQAAVRGLHQLAEGQAAQVLSLDCQGYVRRRLLDLGLVPGTRVEAVLSSAAGDPRAYRVRGTLVALRQSDACQIRVTLEDCP